jgi:hypothetical protein
MNFLLEQTEEISEGTYQLVTTSTDTLKQFGKLVLEFHDSRRENTHFGILFPKEFYIHEKNSAEFMNTIDKSVNINPTK